MERQKSRSLLALAAFGLATAGAAWYSARSSRHSVRGTAYRKMNEPAFEPRDKAFPVVSTTLYALIAWSGWRIWSAAPSRDRNKALRLWLSQLAANAQWSKQFFGRNRPNMAMADVFAIEGMLISYMTAARKVDHAAAAAFIPYAAWVAFAAVLNSEIARLRPE